MKNNYRNIFGPIYQGINERIAYIFDWEQIGEPTSPLVTLMIDQTWVSASANFSGSVIVSGCQVMTPLVCTLSSGSTYRLSCRSIIGGNTYEVYGTIIGEQ